MAFVIKGCNHKDGEYQGRAFDYFQFFGHDDKGNWDMVKVNNSIVVDSGFKDGSALVNNTVNFLYNKFGKVEKIQIANK